MIKKELLAMKPLRATPKMMRLAAEDIHKEYTVRYGGFLRSETMRTYQSFQRCTLENGILKVSMFSPKAMRLGGRLPVYDLFIDRAAKKFLTHDWAKNRWLTGMLSSLDWDRDGAPYSAERWMSPADQKLLKNYLQVNEDGMDAIQRFQEDIRAEELRLRHKRQTDKWDADLEQTPAFPKDWERWLHKSVIEEHFIFYEYSKNGATRGYCSYCQKEVPIKNPRYNKTGVCPCCRKKVIFKSIGKVGYVQTNEYTAYLPQQCKDGMMLREFVVRQVYYKGKHTTPTLFYHEIRRALFDPYGKQLRAYCWGIYKMQYFRWIATDNCFPGWNGYGRHNGKVYGKTLPGLTRRGLGRTGLIEHIKQKSKLDPEKYLAVYNAVPLLEQLSKANLPQMVNECLENYYSYAETIGASKETSLTKCLGIDAQGMKRLRNNHAGIEFVKWLRGEKATGKILPDEVILWYCKEGLSWKDINFITDRMDAVQIYHYIRRNMREYKMPSRQVLITWADYLSMAKKFNYNVADEYIYRTKKLKQRHDELAARSDANISIQAGRILQKFPDLEKIIQSLANKYSYRGKEYIISAPADIEEIIMEGRCLNHCIANSERYWERMERHESYLLFLRKARVPNEPYYTMEIEPDGTVRQIRTYGDNQNEDIAQVKGFLKEWQAVVAKRLTADDRQKAEESKVLRVQEFTQMRKDQVKIHTGQLAGKLLIDVLSADLMENTAA